MRKTNADQINHIVVHSPTWVGDAVMSLPALHALRRTLPKAHITVAARRGTADIFIESNSVDDVLIQERSGLFSILSNASEWKRRQFDLAVLLQNAFAAAATAFFARVPMRIGYATDRRARLLTTALPLPVWKNERHESFYYLNIVAEFERIVFGASSLLKSEPVFDLPVSESRKNSARRILNEHGAIPARPLAIVCPGSVNSRAKRWPAESYAELADRLIDAGMNVVLIGSPAEIDVSRQVCAQAKRQPIVLTGKTSVAELVALIRIADVLVTNDTGPAHLGAALRTPTLVIFGPTNPLTTYPLSAQAEVIRHPPDCAPCMLRDCPIDHRCMTAISVAEVFQRAMTMIEKTSAQVFG
ncbi:MAG TPA: lipopolysaccharide heptosyltransferase II [Blastocatellia bacterium]|nr:lipopolysaccharide heptosyltransferase II [Blastocatellia bacterium]